MRGYLVMRYSSTARSDVILLLLNAWHLCGALILRAIARAVDISHIRGADRAANLRLLYRRYHRRSTSMELANIRTYTHKHCRFKLRNGKEVFGVIWEVETQAGTLTEHGGPRLFFASIRDYERLQTGPNEPVSIIDMPPEEIINVESLAS